MTDKPVMLAPVPGGVFTSGLHDNGSVDVGRIYNPIGWPVTACRAGRIIYVGWLDGYGLTVKVETENECRIQYSHLCHAFKLTGLVQQCEVIALMGATGKVDGPDAVHVHPKVRDLRPGSPTRNMLVDCRPYFVYHDGI